MVEDEEDASKYSMMVRTGVIDGIVGVDATAAAAAAGGGAPTVAVVAVVAISSSSVRKARR